MNWKVIELPKEKYPIKAEFEMKPIGVTIHETDNNASAENEIAYMQRNDNKVSFHFAVDEKEIIQGLPLDRNAWHCGDGRNGKGNRQTIAIEICRNYRTDDLTNYYKARENAEKLVGYLLKKYGWTDKDIYTHNTWNSKNCPRVILKEKYLDTFKANAMAHKGDKPSFKSYSFNIPKGSTLYNAKGKAYPTKTTQAHKVTITKENGDLGNFKASWLKGVDNAWVKLKANKPKFKEYSHTIPRGSTLYNAQGSPYSAKTTNPHTVTILEDKGSLGRFKASWLKGVSEAWVKINAKPSTPSTVRLGGKTRLFVNATGSATYPVPSTNKYTTLQQRPVSVLKEQGSRYQVRIPNFKPEVLWIAKSEVK